MRPSAGQPADKEKGHLAVMRKWWPLLLLAMGLAALVLAFLYDVLFVGLPYQDAPPELQARYETGSKVVAVIAWCGIAIMVLGIAGGLRRIVRRQR